MEHFAGIDVSLEQSSVCVVDGDGQDRPGGQGGERARGAGRGFSASSAWRSPGSGWRPGRCRNGCMPGCGRPGFEAVLLETRHVKAALSAMIVKTDRNDARGIAQLLRMGWFRPVHAKTAAAQEIRALLVARKLLQGKLLDVELSIRGILRGFGLKMGEVSKGRFAARIRELVAGHAMLEGITEPMLRAREALRPEYSRLHRELLAASSRAMPSAGG